MKTPRRVLVIITSLIAATLVVGASPAAPVSAATCQATGEGCALGMPGPNGGIIFYDAGSQQWWGRFLEAETASRPASMAWGPMASNLHADGDVAADRQSMAIGMGATNTAKFAVAGSPLAVQFASGGWHIPSKDELDALYDFWRLNPAGFSYGDVPVWASSESEDTFMWYQLFHDGTQFTDANGIIANLKTNKLATKSATHSGSGFTSAQMHVIRVRALPATGAQPPAPSLVTAPTTNIACSQSAVACQVGNTGPGGGIIVYDAGSNQSWGRYLEIAPKSCEVSRVSYSNVGTGSLFPTAEARVRSKAIGTGAENTRRLKIATHATSAANSASQTCNGLTDWFLPSKGELNEAFRWLSHSRTGLQLTPVGQFERGYYWTSSDYNGKTAWTQYFADGQQFDRIQQLTGNMKPPARPFYVRPMRAFTDGQVATSVTTPSVSGARSLTITGTRATVGGKSGIRVDGVSTGFPEGTVLKSWFRFPGEVVFAQGTAQIVIGQDGTFTWSRKTGKKFYAYVQAPDNTQSNRVIIAAN